MVEILDGAAIERVATGSGHRIVHDALRYGADKFGIHIEGLFLDMMYRGLPGFVAVQVYGGKSNQYDLLRSQGDKP